MFFSLAFSINENVIEVHYHKNFKFLRQNLMDIALEYSWCIGQFQTHFLVLKIAIMGSESCFLFIFFFDLYPIINISQIELDEMSSST